MPLNIEADMSDNDKRVDQVQYFGLQLESTPEVSIA